MNKDIEETHEMGQIVEIDDAKIQDHFGELGRGTVGPEFSGQGNRVAESTSGGALFTAHALPGRFPNHSNEFYRIKAWHRDFNTARR